jgi:hypothetical protein
MTWSVIIKFDFCSGHQESMFYSKFQLLKLTELKSNNISEKNN